MADPIETRPVSRRTVLKGVAGVAGLATVPAIIAACGTSGTSAAPTTAASATPAASTPVASASASAAATGTVTLGSNYSDAVPKGVLAGIVDTFTKDSGITVKINTVDHGTFQDQISSYLQGTPDDSFTWFSGFRMRFFAAQGLATDISDVWAKVGANYSDAFKVGSTGDVRVSMRSKYDVDVRAVANQYGGGGHKNAAGFSVDLADWLARFVC